MQGITVFFENSKLKWIDVCDPSSSQLNDLAKTYNIPKAALDDCMDSRHLPKVERIGALYFFITRMADPLAKFYQTSIQEFTRKVAIFAGDSFVITIHRTSSPFLIEVRDDLKSATSEQAVTQDIVLAILSMSISSFDSLVDQAENEVDSFEADLFTNDTDESSLQKVHYIRRKLFGVKRLFLHHLNMMQKIDARADKSTIVLQSLKGRTDHALFYADELLEDVNELLHLQVALSSKKTNEVVRVLTVFSVFFMPLTFIVGIFGMNFRNMPELEWEYGYLLSWIVMGVVTIAIGLWFHHRGWLSLRKGAKKN